jgi:hypothetical protein
LVNMTRKGVMVIVGPQDVDLCELPHTIEVEYTHDKYVSQ